MPAQDQGLDHAADRYQMVARTLTFVTSHSDVLLIRRPTNTRLWPNRYNGIGGHVERGESIQSAALREIHEETGLRELTALTLRAVITVDAGHPSAGVLIFVFTAASSTRKVRPSAEGVPTWVDWRSMPEQELVEDLPVLLPRILDPDSSHGLVFAHYSYDAQDRLLVTFR